MRQAPLDHPHTFDRAAADRFVSDAGRRLRASQLAAAHAAAPTTELGSFAFESILVFGIDSHVGRAFAVRVGGGDLSAEEPGVEPEGLAALAPEAHAGDDLHGVPPSLTGFADDPRVISEWRRQAPRGVATARGRPRRISRTLKMSAQLAAAFFVGAFGSPGPEEAQSFQSGEHTVDVGFVLLQQRQGSRVRDDPGGEDDARA